jgi:hypothetical protein
MIKYLDDDENVHAHPTQTAVRESNRLEMAFYSTVVHKKM